MHTYKNLERDIPILIDTEDVVPQYIWVNTKERDVLLYKGLIAVEDNGCYRFVDAWDREIGEF